MIGKGPRSSEVTKAIVRHGAAYFCAIGGAGALAALAVKKLEVIAVSYTHLKKVAISHTYKEFVNV